MFGWLNANAIVLVNGLAFAALLYTISVGLSLVLGMMKVLNLAHGTLYLVGGYIAVALGSSRPSWSSFLLALAVSAGVGVLAGSGLAAMVDGKKRRSENEQVLLTLGAALIGSELLVMHFGGSVRSLAAPAGLDGVTSLFGKAYPVYRLVLIGVGVLLVLTITLVMERSPIGAIVRATVADPEMVRAIGIDTRKVSIGVFAAGAVLATVGGVLGGPMLGAAPGLDSQILLISLVVVVIGGLGSVRGAVLGAVLIGELQVLGTSLLPQLAPFLLFGAMAVVLVVRPNGLLGDSTRTA